MPSDRSIDTSTARVALNVYQTGRPPENEY